MSLIGQLDPSQPSEEAVHNAQLAVPRVSPLLRQDYVEVDVGDVDRFGNEELHAMTQFNEGLEVRNARDPQFFLKNLHMLARIVCHKHEADTFTEERMKFIFSQVREYSDRFLYKNKEYEKVYVPSHHSRPQNSKPGMHELKMELSDALNEQGWAHLDQARCLAYKSGPTWQKYKRASEAFSKVALLMSVDASVRIERQVRLVCDIGQDGPTQFNGSVALHSCVAASEAQRRGVGCSTPTAFGSCNRC